MAEWFESFFDALAHDVWRGFVSDEQSDAEARFLADALALEPGHPSHLLDAPSGDGRLAVRLAAMGHRITGVDLSPVAIERLGEQARERGVAVEAVMTDLRRLRDVLPAGVEFDGAYCMGNSFGYLDDDGTLEFVRAVGASLRRGGRFVIDHPLAAECILARYGTHQEVRAGDVGLLIENSYEPATSTIVGTMTLERGGEIAHRVVRHRVTTCAQVVSALDASGFDVVDLLGGIDRRSFVLGAPTLIVVATRR